MKEKFKTTSFWLGLSASVVIALDCLSSILNVRLYSQEIGTVILSLCSVLVIMGVVTKKTTGDKSNVDKEELLQELQGLDGEIEDKNKNSEEE